MFCTELVYLWSLPHFKVGPVVSCYKLAPPLVVEAICRVGPSGGARVFRRRDFQRTSKPKRKRVKTRASSELHLLRIDQDVSTLINVLNVSVSAIYGQYFCIIQVTNVCFFPSSLLRKTSKKLHEIRFISIKFCFTFVAEQRTLT